MYVEAEDGFKVSIKLYSKRFTFCKDKLFVQKTI